MLWWILGAVLVGVVLLVVGIALGASSTTPMPSQLTLIIGPISEQESPHGRNGARSD